MAYGQLKDALEKELQNLKETGLFKEEKIISSPQGTDIKTNVGEFINFCANNYLGLADHPEILHAVEGGLKERGFGMASVRFICGTQDIHKQLEKKISNFLRTDDMILY